ncbi:MAG: hypothetical protein ACWGSQ_19255, partial [Longimicrobiales bacterium]
MLRIARAPPVVGLALAAGTGATLLHLGVHPSWTLLSLLSLFRPNPSFRRPPPASCRFPASPLPLPLVLSFLAGSFLAHAWIRESARDCRLLLAEGEFLEVRGRLVGRLAGERGEIRPWGGGPGGCDRPLRFVLGRGASARLRETVTRPGGACRAQHEYDHDGHGCHYGEHQLSCANADADGNGHKEIGQLLRFLDGRAK